MLLGAFVVLAPFAGLGPWQMAHHFGAGLLVLAVGILLFIPGWIGGGDAKLAAAVALWMGFENLFPTCFSWRLQVACWRRPSALFGECPCRA